MKPEQAATRAIWAVLAKIKEELIIIAPDNRATYEVAYDNPEFPSPEKQMDILYLLTNIGVLNGFEVERRYKPVQMMLRVNRKAFEGLYDEIKGNRDNPDFDITAVLWKKNSRGLSKLQELAKGAEWKEITIRILNGNEAIVRRGTESLHLTYEDLELQDKRTKKPDLQWDFLRKLACNNGEISFSDELKRGLSIEEIKKNMKKKEFLSKALKKAFGLKEDPFYPYKRIIKATTALEKSIKDESYRIKLKLEPEAEDDIPVIRGGKFDDIDEYMKEQSPSRYSEE